MAVSSWFLKSTVFQLKESELLGEITESKADIGTKKKKNEPGAPFLASVKKCSKMDGDMSRGHTCQPGRASFCQITDN